jgi:probable F420-dependent oxidoreductase
MTVTALADLGTVGLWTHATGDRSPADALALARRVEEAGLGCLWIPEGIGWEALTHAALLLGATSTLPVATGIASIWARDALAAHSGTRLLRAAWQERFVLGLGVSHRLVVDFVRGQGYRQPLTAMTGYLRQLAELDVGSGSCGPVVIAALGPRMLDLATATGSGVLTYLTTVEHTADSRRRLGATYLGVELPVVVTADQSRARRVARRHLATYLNLENYVASLRRLGFSDSDLSDGGSDRLIDSLVSYGSPDDVRAAVAARLEAGADHVAVQPLDNSSLDALLAAPDEWRQAR